MKIRHLFAAAATAVLTAGTFGATVSAPAAAATPRSGRPAPHVIIRGFRVAPGIRVPRTHLPHLSATGITTSGNWSGYAAVADKGVSLRFVSANWNVPSINATSCDTGTSGYSYVGHWIGLDGFGDNTVEQTGVAAYCTSHDTAKYYAWYEMFPGPAVKVIGVHPGDAISANVYYDGTANVYDLTLTDLSTGSFIHADGLSCTADPCRNASAEVITEVPGGGPPAYTLADFGMINYTGTNVTSRNGTRGTLAGNNLWKSSGIDMVDSGHHLATPSPLEGGQAFNVAWNASS